MIIELATTQPAGVTTPARDLRSGARQRCALLGVVIACVGAACSSAKRGIVVDVRRGKILAINPAQHRASYRVSGHPWKAVIPFDAQPSDHLLKEGQSVSINEFRANDEVVIVCPASDPRVVYEMADVESYAAFWHHRTAGGDFLDIRDRQIELTPPGDPRTTNGHQDTIAYDIDQRTQLWIGGARRNVGEASTLLQKGVRIYVADAGVKAYAIFDQRSWRAFAKHELPLVKNVIHCGSRSVNARPVRCQ